MHKVVLAVTLFILTGCVSTQTVLLSEENGRLLRDQSVVVSKRNAPVFTASTPSMAMGGVNKGPALVKEHRIPDPSGYISTTLINDLAFKFNTRMAGKTESVWKSNNNNEIVQLPSRARYVLDLQTVNWGYVYFPTNWDRYRIIYAAKLRLVDTQTDTILAESFCRPNFEIYPEDSNAELAPLEAELLAESSRLLKERLVRAANYCITWFRNDALGIGEQYATAPITPPAETGEANAAASDDVSDSEVPVAAATVPQNFSVVDLTGTYTSFITGDLYYIDLRGKRKPVVKIEQNGNRISGTFGRNTLAGEIVDNVVNFTWSSARSEGKGRWKIMNGGQRLEGTWHDSSAGNGDWNLKKTN